MMQMMQGARAMMMGTIRDHVSYVVVALVLAIAALIKYLSANSFIARQ